MRCRNPRGPNHRGGTATTPEDKSCPRSRHGCSQSAAVGSTVCRLSRRLLCDFRSRWSANSQRGGDFLCFGRLQELLKVAVFREDIGERLLHHFIGGSVDEGGILIDLCSGRIGQPNRGAEVTGWDDFKQWHCVLL